MSREKTPSDPFQFFGLPAAFGLDAESLRASYFQICRTERDNPAALVQAHAAYQILSDPVQRLDILIEKENLAPLPETNLPTEILTLYDKAESTNDLPVLLKQLEDRYRDLLEAVPPALADRDRNTLSELRACLAYLKRLKSIVYTRFYESKEP